MTVTAEPDPSFLDHELVENDGALDELVARLLGEPRYALDTEFHREGSYFPHPALVQLAWTDGRALVDPLAVDLRRLRPLLEGPATAVLHAASQDLELLALACGAVPSSLVDTQVLAGFVGFSTPSLDLLLRRVLGVGVPKASRLTDWLRRPLRPEQRQYAVGDVAHLLALADALAAAVEQLGRGPWAADECAAQLARSWTPGDADDAWLRIKECRSLRSTTGRAVAQAVAGWRERRARALDQPVRTVLPDLAIVAIANKPPRSQDELRQLRGVDGRIGRGNLADEVLAAVADGLTRTDVQAPVSAEDVPRHLRPAVTLAVAWVGQLGHHLGIDAGLLGSRADVARFLAGDESSRLSSGWRAELLADPLRRLAAGEMALALDGEGGVVLERRSGDPAEIEQHARFSSPW